MKVESEERRLTNGSRRVHPVNARHFKESSPIAFSSPFNI